MITKKYNISVSVVKRKMMDDLFNKCKTDWPNLKIGSIVDTALEVGTSDLSTFKAALNSNQKQKLLAMDKEKIEKARTALTLMEENYNKNAKSLGE